MAGLRCIVPFSGIALAAGVLKTVIQIKAPANQRVRIVGWRLGFNGTVTTDGPIKIQGYQQTSAGTGPGSSPSAGKLDRSLAETPLTTAQLAPTGAAWTTEPTLGDLQYNNRCHPQGSNSETFYFTTEIFVAGNERFGLVLTAPVGNSVDGELIWEE